MKDTTVYGKGSSEDKLLDVLIQVFLCSSKIIKSFAFPASLCTLAIWIWMPALRKPRGCLVFFTSCLISPRFGRLCSPFLAGDCGTVVLNEELNRQKQCSMYLEGNRLTKILPRKKSKIICICLGWGYSPVAEICASFFQERKKGEDKGLCYEQTKLRSTGYRALGYVWHISQRKHLQGCCSPSPSCTTAASASEVVLGKATRVHALTSRARAGSISGTAGFGFTYSILPVLHKEMVKKLSDSLWVQHNIIVNATKTFGFQQCCFNSYTR